MISESKVIFCHLREYFCESPSSKMSHYGIMATQLLAMSTTVHHLLKGEIVVYLVNLRHLLHSIPLDVCSMSQLERCFNASLHELILSCSIFEKIDPSRVFPFPLVVLSVGVLRARHRDKDGDRINVLTKCNLDREDHVSSYPLCLLTSRLESRDEILV